jgi:CRISPR type I-E-associated protein CasB/Cse2
MTLNLSEEQWKALAAEVLKWWRGLHPTEANRGNADRAGRARLRRAGSVIDIQMEEAFQDLVMRLRSADIDVGPRQGAELAICAAILAELPPGGDASGSFARALGQRDGDADSPRLSVLRFNALIKALEYGEPDDRLRALRRAAGFLEGLGETAANRLVRDLLAFNDQTRVSWVYAYFETTRLRDDETSEHAEKEETTP